jgi:hypothetical protein
MKKLVKNEVVEIVQWNRLGDHAQVKLMDVSKSKTTPVDKKCGKLWSEHGVLHARDRIEIVCPGEYIVTHDNDTYEKVNEDQLKDKYEDIK